MRRTVVFCAAGLLMACLWPSAEAAEPLEYGQHYYSGSDGLKAGSLRDPGFAVVLRTTYDYSDRWHDNAGNSRYHKREIFFTEPELSWTSGEPLFLGARYAALIAVPFPYHQEDMAVKDANASRRHITMEVGDLRVTPLMLGWDFDWLEVTAGYTFFAPTGQFSYQPSAAPAAKADRPNAGKGYWTHMFNLGGTVYFDGNRSWNASLMAHYEIHTRQNDTDIRYGQNLHFEGGVGKDFCSGWRAGVAFFGSLQTTDNDYRVGRDYGSGNRIFAAGPEVGYFARQSKLPWFATVRGLQEFGAKGSMQGFRSLLTAGLCF